MNFDTGLTLSKGKINQLVSGYSALDYSVKLSELLKSVFPMNNFDSLSKFDLHKLYNEIILKNYKGEEILKYKLFEKHINRQNLIAAFEVKVNRSRVDFLTINGSTTSFEIKSELDNLTKLAKQCADYLLAFEYNYLMIHESHVEKSLEIVPESFGIWSFNDQKYSKLRKAKLNSQIQPEIQLGLLTKAERERGFKKTNGTLDGIIDLYDAKKINNQFKKILKNRYAERWDFIVSNNREILPIDVQFFFNTNVCPSLIYQH
ncbi:hypothetical protein P700755_002015 [Psychroflexus torquis ATCC 700755]|uniref:Sce7726 family protein n=1 Tax=Psychroflexus torquis (strain ATCC 700755 / CIP 106069 / ACAM 623) TaxID=313595 RepID=K4ITJ8_PSYTT|nr:sce7726 family protein [Psychroflexus torquis]AFU68810.1 hypothetical protein P700755_002015 [Psychroflexus torquis ATCC 700755]